MSETYSKQLPVIDSTTKPFWDGARRHQLMAYKCLNCGTFYWPAIDCMACDNSRMEWAKVSGKGYVYTFVVYHQLYHPGWKPEIPYNVSWIKLDEGAILLSNLVECKNEEIYVGMPVEVVFDDITEEITLPKFKPVK
jgi:uncharacterized protein